jgi:hypothetical protein
MTTPRSRFRHHLSYANVMASIAVFVALGGGAYAAATINGSKIIKGTVGGAKLKKGTITSTQVKANSLNGGAIDESSLGTVPSAQTAQTAASATTAATATTAGNANTADSANTAQSANTANHALSADTASKASTAASADFALSAENADTLNGFTSKQLLVSCPSETELFGGMCWDEDVRPADDWIDASEDCGVEGGRLPSLSELIAYVLQDGEQVEGQNWTGDVIDVSAGKETVLTSDEGLTSSTGSSPTNLDYRCLFYRVN